MEMEKAISRDGTPIAYWHSGAGAALVLVHGTSADHTRWAPILPALEQRFTVYAIDRRGRGGSGDAPAYAIEREFEDVAAVVEAIGGKVNVLGHSYGAECSLGAALQTTRLERLILYEPPLPIVAEATMYPPAVIKKMQDLLEAGDRAGVVTTFMQEVVRVPPHELDMLRAAPAWPARLAAAHTILREVSGEVTHFNFSVEQLHSMHTPTLLLAGGDSPSFLASATAYLHAELPDNRLAVLPGQQHTAMNTAPDLFLREVLGFLT